MEPHRHLPLGPAHCSGNASDSLRPQPLNIVPAEHGGFVVFGKTDFGFVHPMLFAGDLAAALDFARMYFTTSVTLKPEQLNEAIFAKAEPVRKTEVPGGWVIKAVRPHPEAGKFILGRGVTDGEILMSAEIETARRWAFAQDAREFLRASDPGEILYQIVRA